MKINDICKKSDDFMSSSVENRINKPEIRMFRMLIVQLLLVIFSCIVVSLTFYTYTVTAASNPFGQSIKNNPKTICNPKQNIDGKYAFTPLIGVQSKITYSSKSGCKIEPDSNPNDPKNSYQLTSSNNNGDMEATFLYTNVGFSVDGKPIDAFVDVNIFNANDGATINPIGRVNLKSSTTRNDKLSARVTLKFFEHNTTTPIEVTGHLTFSNINDAKVVTLNLEDFDNIYCTDDTIIQTAPNSKDNNLTDLSSNTWNGDKPNSRFTGVFSNKQSFTYSFHSSTKNGSKTVGTGFDTATLFDFDIPNANKAGTDESTDSTRKIKDPLNNDTNPRITKILGIPPLKLNKKNDYSKNYAAILDNISASDPWKVRQLYSIVQIMPSHDSGYLTAYEIDDLIDSSWQVNPNNIEIYDENGQNDSSKFTISFDDKNNELIIKANEKDLASSDFYGHTYTFIIKGCLNKQNRSDWKDNLKIPIVSENTSSENIVYLDVLNRATVKSVTKNNTTKESQVSASNHIKFYRPVVSTEKSIYNGDKSTITGNVSDLVLGNNQSGSLSFYITYLNNKNQKVIDQPWSINDSDSNQLKNPVPGNELEWKAKLPTDILVNSDVNYSQDILVKVVDQDGFSNEVKFTLGPWWNINKGVLTIYPHQLNWNTDHSNNETMGFPWSNNNTVTQAIFNESVSATESLAYLFSGCSKLNKIDGLSDLETKSVTDMQSMFADCSNLQTLDLSKWNMKEVKEESNMFSNTKKLWKITLGPNNYIGNAGLMDAPGSGTFPSNFNYASKSPNWQEVGDSSNDYEPQGKVLSADDIMENYANGSDKTRTYVWQPFLAGNLIFQKVPLQLDFGSGILGILKWFVTPKEEQEFEVLDDRPLRNGRVWHVDVSVDGPLHLANSNKGNIYPLYFQEKKQNITTEPFELYSETSNSKDTTYDWSFTSEKGFALNFDSSNPIHIPGKYQETINYTLVDGPSK